MSAEGLPITKLLVPAEAHGLRLCKIVGQRLIMCEAIKFVGGAPAADTVLRRAAIAGRVGPLGETGDYWADVLDSEGDMIENIALDRQSWNALKDKWMRCKVSPG